MSTTVQPTTVRPGDTKQQPNPTEPLNGNGRRLSRLHMQKHLPDFGIVLNLFADTPEELWALYSSMLAVIDNEVASAYNRASKASAKPVRQQPKPAAQPKAVIARGEAPWQSHKPVCQECGSDESMELIAWKDKATGEFKKAWKCQSCEKWAR
jgi:hypothetical protein